MTEAWRDEGFERNWGYEGQQPAGLVAYVLGCRCSVLVVAVKRVKTLREANFLLRASSLFLDVVEIRR